MSYTEFIQEKNNIVNCIFFNVLFRTNFYWGGCCWSGMLLMMSESPGERGKGQTVSQHLITGCLNGFRVQSRKQTDKIKPGHHCDKVSSSNGFLGKPICMYENHMDHSQVFGVEVISLPLRDGLFKCWGEYTFLKPAVYCHAYMTTQYKT